MEEKGNGKSKGKGHSLTGHEKPEGVEVKLHSFFNLGARWGGWSTPLLSRFTPRKDRVLHCIGGWVGSRAGSTAA